MSDILSVSNSTNLASFAVLLASSTSALPCCAAASAATFASIDAFAADSLFSLSVLYSAVFASKALTAASWDASTFALIASFIYTILLIFLIFNCCF